MENRAAAAATLAPEGDATLTLADVRAAAERIRGSVVRTPTLHSKTLSKITGAEIWLKFENLQFTAAYKERGALNALLQLTEAQRAKGVIAASAGNHAQGLSYHGTRLGVPVTIVMPKTTPTVKVMQTESVGGKVVLEGETFDEAYAYARSMEQQLGLTFVHPFDDPQVAAGQGTVVLEMLEDAPEIDMLAVPIGGGGLLTGMGTAARGLKPDIGLIGVQAKLYPSMFDRLKHQDLPCGGDTLAEGIAVKEPGAFTSRVLAGIVDDIVLVEEAALESAVALLLQIEKTVVEGAGAAGLAAVMANREIFAGRKGQRAAARSGAVRAAGSTADHAAGSPRRAVQGGGGIQSPSGEHPGSVAPAHLHLAAGQGPDGRDRMRGARPRADRPAGRGAARQGVRAGAGRTGLTLPQGGRGGLRMVAPVRANCADQLCWHPA
ncbi:MAG: hypothetical protein RIS94_3138 [Pseudomonadota bacterium]